jgi:tRNA(Arg) A34 adenosine deaminase TadA
VTKRPQSWWCGAPLEAGLGGVRLAGRPWLLGSVGHPTKMQNGCPAGSANTYRGSFWSSVRSSNSSTEVTNRNPLDHDVLAVLREACRRLGSSDLRGCTFYGTAEPCPMCSAALLQTRIGRIVIGASGSALADLLGPRALLIEDLAVDYAVQPQIERGLENQAAPAILARSLTDHPSEH